MRHIGYAFCNPVAVRRLFVAFMVICGLALATAVGVGIFQAGSSDRAPAEPMEPLSRAQVSKPLAGASPPLAALRSRGNDLQAGGAKAFDAQLRALRGHPVVVNMWASWCEPCRDELPFLQRQALRRGARVAFLGINVNDAKDAAAQRAAQFPMPYPSFEDPRGNLFARYRARGLPTTAFYDKR